MANPDPGLRLLKLWHRLSPLPGGKWLFALIFGRTVPYSGSVGPRIDVLEPGLARVSIPDRRSNRQHLGSVHAIALMNVAEMASGLAMLTALPPGFRGIVTKIGIEYVKKARGRITAEARAELPDLSVEGDHIFVSECRDPAGDVVARAAVTWRLGPVKPR